MLASVLHSCALASRSTLLALRPAASLAARHAQARSASFDALSACRAPPEPADEDVEWIVSHHEVAQLYALRDRAPDAGAAAVRVGPPDGFTVNLGKGVPKELVLSAEGVGLGVHDELPCVTWAELAKLVKKRKVGAWLCYHGATGLAADKAEAFSELTNRQASLLPLPAGVGPPTAVLGGFNMHRMKGVTPGEDTARKLNAFGGGLRGRCLDVCTGLGYTAIGMARRPGVEEVVTIELDPAMVAMQRANPWSAELFDDPKITRLRGDATELLPRIPDGRFDAAVHDPPTQSMSGELYSLALYTELARVLRPNGALFHYIGDPASKASGRLFKGVAERLREAGFATTVAPQAFGIVGVAGGNSRAGGRGL